MRGGTRGNTHCPPPRSQGVWGAATSAPQALPTAVTRQGSQGRRCNVPRAATPLPCLRGGRTCAAPRAQPPSPRLRCRGAEVTSGRPPPSSLHGPLQESLRAAHSEARRIMLPSPQAGYLHWLWGMRPGNVPSGPPEQPDCRSTCPGHTLFTGPGPSQQCGAEYPRQT